MTKSENEQKINVDGIEYQLKDLSVDGRAQLENIQFCDLQLQQLNNEWAVADTARIGYSNALKAELSKINEGE